MKSGRDLFYAKILRRSGVLVQLELHSVSGDLHFFPIKNSLMLFVIFSAVKEFAIKEAPVREILNSRDLLSQLWVVKNGKKLIKSIIVTGKKNFPLAKDFYLNMTEAELNSFWDDMEKNPSVTLEIEVFDPRLIEHLMPGMEWYVDGLCDRFPNINY